MQNDTELTVTAIAIYDNLDRTGYHEQVMVLLTCRAQHTLNIRGYYWCTPRKFNSDLRPFYILIYTLKFRLLNPSHAEVSVTERILSEPQV